MTAGEGVRDLVTPASIAMVGTTGKPDWSMAAFANPRRHGFGGSNTGGARLSGTPCAGGGQADPRPQDSAVTASPRVRRRGHIRPSPGADRTGTLTRQRYFRRTEARARPPHRRSLLHEYAEVAQR